MKDILVYVNFCHKDKIKQLGCKWNPKLQSWYFPLSNSLTNLKDIIKLKNKITIYFIKEKVSDWNAKSRNDCFKIEYRDCYHIVEYKDDEILKIHHDYNTKSDVDDSFIDYVTDECSVCLEIKELKKKYFCNHVFCDNCNIKWKKNTCPLCRSK